MIARGNQEVFFSHARRWAKGLLKIADVNVNILGVDNINIDTTYVYVSNHSSLYDIPIILASLKQDVRIMYKRELEKIPVFGSMLKKSPYIGITRTNPHNAMSSIDEALKSIKGNVSVIMFPEGTRSKDGNLGPFKRGAFSLASRSGRQIVPVAIIGSTKVLASKALILCAHQKVTVILNKPIQASDSPSRAEEQELMKRIHNIISETIKKEL
jgi:1-acyl-sn-glycerol-3-phosphate acyltransferase